jgi:hypothetical protein
MSQRALIELEPDCADAESAPPRPVPKREGALSEKESGTELGPQFRTVECYLCGATTSQTGGSSVQGLIGLSICAAACPTTRSARRSTRGTGRASCGSRGSPESVSLATEQRPSPRRALE